MKKDDNLNVLKGGEILKVPVVKSSSIDENSINDRSKLVWEESSDLTLSYQHMTNTEKSLLVAALAHARDVNHMGGLSEEEKNRGFIISCPIRNIAQLMGYDLEKDKVNKSYYRAIRTASKTLRQATFIREIKNANGTKGFEAFGLIDRILYNDNGDGNIQFFFNGAASNFIFGDDSIGNFTLYSIILRNKMKKIGQLDSTRLHEILKRSFYLAKRSGLGMTTVYYDFIDLKCKMGFINIEDKAVVNILNDKRFEDLSNKKIAYDRALEMEAIDKKTREELIQLKSEEYDKNDKDAVIAHKARIKNKNDRIVCQYNSYLDFKKRVLVPAQKVFKEMAETEPELMEFMYEFTPVSFKTKVIGINFTIYTLKAYEKKILTEDGVQMTFDDFGYMSDNGSKVEAVEDSQPQKKTQRDINESFNAFFTHITTHPNGYTFEPADIMSLVQEFDHNVLIEKYDGMKSVSACNNPLGWLIMACRENWDVSSTSVNKKPNTTFHNFDMKHNYDFDRMEEVLLDRGNQRNPDPDLSETNESEE